jgi:hypothetical protein
MNSCNSPIIEGVDTMISAGQLLSIFVLFVFRLHVEILLHVTCCSSEENWKIKLYAMKFWKDTKRSAMTSLATNRRSRQVKKSFVAYTENSTSTGTIVLYATISNWIKSRVSNLDPSIRDQATWKIYVVIKSKLSPSSYIDNSRMYTPVIYGWRNFIGSPLPSETPRYTCNRWTTVFHVNR